MKAMKKILAMALTGTLMLSFAACGQQGDKKDTDGKKDAAQGKKYIIAMDTTFTPFEFEDKDGKRVGVDVDLLAAIAEDQGFQYEAQALGFDAALQAVEADQADAILAGCSITDARKKKFDFSTPYYDSGIGMAVAKDNDTIKGYEDLKGKKVAVKTGTEGATFADSIKDKYGFEITSFDESPFMYEDVKAGNTVACFEDYPVMGYAIKQGVGLKMVGEMEQGSSYGLGVNKGKNAELLTMFNKGLENIKANGKYKEIIDKYIQE